MGKPAAWARASALVLVTLLLTPAAAAGMGGSAGWVPADQGKRADRKQKPQAKPPTWRLVRPARSRPAAAGAGARQGKHGVGAQPVRRWFSDPSPLNTPIAAGAEVDPSSAAMVKALQADAETKRWSIGVKYYSVPIYYSGPGTKRYTVSLTASWRPRSALVDAPIPDDARPDPGSDGHMAVIDTKSGCFYEYFEARRVGSGWQAKWANRGLMSGTGIQPKGYSTRDAGFVNFAGLIRPEELKAGVIDHALVFSTMYTAPGGVVAPATSGTGVATAPSGALPLPEGAHVQLDPRLDLNSLGLEPWQKTIARALQVYGMYLVDTGSLGLYAVNPLSFGTNPYSEIWGDGNYAFMPTSLVSRLRVLKLGPRFNPHPAAEVLPSPCGELR
jgi:hypothetical protein